MPLFDFRCRSCGTVFERLVRPGAAPACPECAGVELDRLPSSFAVSSAERTKQAAAKNIKRHQTAAAKDSMAVERETARHRHEDH